MHLSEGPTNTTRFMRKEWLSRRKGFTLVLKQVRKSWVDFILWKIFYLKDIPFENKQNYEQLRNESWYVLSRAKTVAHTMRASMGICKLSFLFACFEIRCASVHNPCSIYLSNIFGATPLQALSIFLPPNITYFFNIDEISWAENYDVMVISYDGTWDDCSRSSSKTIDARSIDTDLTGNNNYQKQKISGVILLHFRSASMPRYNAEIQHTISDLSLSCITTTSEEQLNLN